MESYKGLSFANRTVQESSSSTSDSGSSLSSDKRPDANGSRFPEKQVETANKVTSNSSSYKSNVRIVSNDIGENAMRRNTSRLPLAVWRMKRSSATSMICRDDTTVVEDGRRKNDVSRLPMTSATSNSKGSDCDSELFHRFNNESIIRWRQQASSSALTTVTTCRNDTIVAKNGWCKREVSRLPAMPVTSNSRELDFDSAPSAVFHESDNDLAVRWQRQPYIKPEDRCDRFDWSDIVTNIRRPQWKLGGGNGDNVANRRTVTRTQSDWAAAEKLERLAKKKDKILKKQEVVDAYTGGLNQTSSVPVKAGQRTSSYINRKAKERETARINAIMVKKILNVKSTLSTRR